MVLDMNYWGKVLKNIVDLALTILGVFLGFKLSFY